MRWGFSIATVSYVYNNRWQEKRINKQLAAKIMKKLQEENYHPNYLSRQLMIQKTQSVGIILGDLSRIFNLNILCGIEKVLSKAGYFSIIGSSKLGIKEKEYLAIMQTSKADGVILSPHIKLFVPHKGIVFGPDHKLNIKYGSKFCSVMVP